MTLPADVERTFRTRDLIEDLLSEPRQLGPDYQPIRRLADNAVVAYKATGSGKPGTDLADTLALLDEARALGLVERIDWAFRALAFEDFFGREGVELHLTPEPETYGTLCPPRLAATFARAKREVQVAAEVHAAAFADASLVRRGVAEAREWGWRIVVADVADDPAALELAAVLRPDMVQVDLAKPGRDAASGASGHAGVDRLVGLARDSGAELMALGIDGAGSSLAAQQLGCTLGRGRLFGNPGPLPALS